MNKKISRLDFLKTVGLATSGVIIGGNSTAELIGSQIAKSSKISPGRKVNMALIGIGNQGAGDARQFINSGLANIVAVCDVDLDSQSCQETIKLVPKARQFRDWRIMFDKMAGEFDAVQVAIPDFAHFPVCMAAMQLGKHVFVEKPMCRTFYEAELLAQAANKYPKLATQVGNQGHSGENYFQFKAWKEAGIIKDVTAVTAFMNSSRRWHPWDPNIIKYPEAQPLPIGMTDKDWDTWLSTAAYHEFNEKYHPGNWRGWYDFGLGALGDWGAHILDTIHEFLELGLPYEINPIHIRNHNDFFFPLESTILFRFPSRGDMPACDITWYDGVENLPPLPEGYDKVTVRTDTDIPSPGGAPEQGGRVQVRPGQQVVASRTIPGQAGQQVQQGAQQRRLSAGKVIYSKELTFIGGTHSAPLSIIPPEKAKEMESKLPPVPESPSNHYVNFLKACMGEEKARSSFQIFAPLTQIFSMGVIAMRLNRKLIFNRETKEITNDKFANALLVGSTPRKGWESYYYV
ncbi:MAG TPA: Gfo/Idh/MocA family oxidoreductase [Sedimentibacter sp.]|nr:Gfo/Idh/MocA family oxidoreductase [Sedimentibacter sp.]